MLAELSFSFSLIGLIETWINNYSDHSMDFHLPGYTFISQPTKLKAEGVDAFIHDDINFHIRDDLSFSTDECEMLWVEIAFLFVCLFVCSNFLSNNTTILNFSIEELRTRHINIRIKCRVWLFGGCRNFDSCWEHSDFSFNPTMPVSLSEKHHLPTFKL